MRNENDPTTKYIRKLELIGIPRDYTDLLLSKLHDDTEDTIKYFKREYGSNWEIHWVIYEKASYELVMKHRGNYKPIIIPEQED